MKYKVGDRVKVRTDLVTGNSYGDYIWNGDHANCTGVIDDIRGDYYNIKFDDGSRDDGTCWTDEMLEPTTKTPEPVVKTLDDIQEGDILVGIDGEEYMVLGRAGQAVFISTTDFEIASSIICTIAGIKNEFKLKEDVKEITLEDIAKKFDIDIDKLRIKD